MGVGGSWIMYDAMADAIMMDTLMGHSGYYYGSPSAGLGGFGGLTLIFMVVFAIIVVGAVFNKGNSGHAE